MYYLFAFSIIAQRGRYCYYPHLMYLRGGEPWLRSHSSGVSSLFPPGARLLVSTRGQREVRHSDTGSTFVWTSSLSLWWGILVRDLTPFLTLQQDKPEEGGIVTDPGGRASLKHKWDQNPGLQPPGSFDLGPRLRWPGVDRVRAWILDRGGGSFPNCELHRHQGPHTTHTALHTQGSQLHFLSKAPHHTHY